MPPKSERQTTQRCPDLKHEDGKWPPVVCRIGFPLDARINSDGNIVFKVPKDCPVIQGTRKIFGRMMKVTCMNVYVPTHPDILYDIDNKKV